MSTASPTASGADVAGEDALLQDVVAAFTVSDMESVADWVRGLVQQVARSAFPHFWVKVYLFGSSGLGAAIEGSDADLMVLSSFNITHDFFFDKLPPLLRKGGENVTLVTAARVPLIKLRRGAVSVDIVFASVAFLAPPTAEQLRQDEFLFTVSADDRYNVNGIRTVLEIRNRVPVPYAVYTTALKAVKRWATRRRVYGNQFTFPNGVVLAIMVARVCLMYSQCVSPSQLFRLFFGFFTYWLARHDCVMPIFITESMKPKPVHFPGMSACWDPSRESCREELLPVLNPAYPYVNAAHSVGRCGFNHFYAELTRANALLSPKVNQPLAAVLSQVWLPYAVTEDYSHFLAVHVACTHPSSRRHCSRLFGVWKGLVESRLRLLVYALECFYDTRPIPRCFERAGGPDGAGERGGVRGRERHPHVMEGVFYFGVKSLPCAGGGDGDGGAPPPPPPPPDPAVLRRCFAELEYAVRESVRVGVKSSHPFEHVPRMMRDPWFTLHHVDDSDFPAELAADYSPNNR